MSSLFVIRFTFRVGLDEVGPHLPGHFAHLARHYADRVFVASGSTVPFDGGVVLARGLDRSELERIVAQDPFVTSGVATAEIVEFSPGLWNTDPAVEAFFGGVSPDPARAADALPAGAIPTGAE